ADDSRREDRAYPPPGGCGGQPRAAAGSRSPAGGVRMSEASIDLPSGERRGTLPFGVSPLLHGCLLPLRLAFILASSLAMGLIFSLCMLLHGGSQLLARLPGAGRLAERSYAVYHRVIDQLFGRWLADRRDEPILAAA